MYIYNNWINCKVTNYVMLCYVMCFIPKSSENFYSDNAFLYVQVITQSDLKLIQRGKLQNLPWEGIPQRQNSLSKEMLPQVVPWCANSGAQHSVTAPRSAF